MKKKFVKMSEALEILGIHYHTLHKWSDEGKIETIRMTNGYRLYNINSVIEQENKNKKRICYCRVSTRNQKDDLERQIAYMQKLYPEHEIITDIGSGLNFKRKGLQHIIELAINGEIEEVVLAHKDRLCRFGYDLIENIIKTYSNGEIKIINNIKGTENEELVKDLVQIINVFSAKINGKRKYTV